jgi:hypothetical protein
VDQEVRGKIAERPNQAQQALARFQKRAGFLEAANCAALAGFFTNADPANLLKEGVEVWERFLREAKVEIVSAADVSGSELLRLYFAKEAPFSATKKDEFPDAITVLALEQWCRTRSATKLWSSSRRWFSRIAPQHRNMVNCSSRWVE